MNDGQHTQNAGGSSRTTGGQRSALARAAGFVFTQLLALVVFVGIPVAVTAIAPVAWTTFERREGRVVARSQVCLMFVIPYRQASIDAVTAVDQRFVGGTETSRRRRSGRDNVKSEDQSFLVIHGNPQDQDAVVEVPVSPVDIDAMVEKSQAFLADQQATELKLFTVANWKFSVFAGGATCLLTVIYVGTIVFGICLKAINAIQRACGVPVERRFMVKLMKALEKSTRTR
jgi:hypothetical protein